MIIEIELVIIALLLACILLKLPDVYRWSSHGQGNKLSVDSAGSNVQILKKIDGVWQHHSYRDRPDHPDVQEAINTPGLAVAINGVMNLGKQ